MLILIFESEAVRYPYLPKLDLNHDLFKLPYVSKLHNLLLIDMFHFVYRDSVKINFCCSTRTDLSPNEGINELCTGCIFRSELGTSERLSFLCNCSKNCEFL